MIIFFEILARVYCRLCVLQSGSCEALGTVDRKQEGMFQTMRKIRELWTSALVRRYKDRQTHKAHASTQTCIAFLDPRLPKHTLKLPWDCGLIKLYLFISFPLSAALWDGRVNCDWRCYMAQGWGLGTFWTQRDTNTSKYTNTDTYKQAMKIWKISDSNKPYTGASQ